MFYGLFWYCTFINESMYFFTTIDGVGGKWNIFGDNCIDFFEVFKEPHNLLFTAAMNEKIYAVDSKGDLLCEYNSKTDEIRMLHLPYENKDFGNFFDMKIYKNNIFIFPEYQNQVMVVNANNLEQKIINLNNDLNFGDKCGCKADDKYYIFGGGSNKVFVINLENCTERIITLNNVIDDCVYSEFYNGIVYLITANGRLYCWDGKGKELILIFDLALPFRVNSFIITEKNIIILPIQKGKDIYIWDRGKKCACIYEGYPEDYSFRGPKNWPNFVGLAKFEGYILTCLSAANYLMVVNRRSGEIEWKKPKNMQANIMKRMLEDGKKFFREKKGVYELNDFITVID